MEFAQQNRYQGPDKTSQAEDSWREDEDIDSLQSCRYHHVSLIHSIVLRLLQILLYFRICHILALVTHVMCDMLIRHRGFETGLGGI